MQQAVAGEGEGIDLDLGLLPRMHEADIAVRDHRLDLEPAVLRNDDGEHLRRHHHAADRVHAELLHHAVDRRREELQLGPALGLDDVPAERGDLLIGLGEIVEQGAAALGRDPVARLLQRCRRCIDLAHLAALDDEVLLHSDEVLVFGEVGQLGAELLPVEIFAQIDPLLQHRYGRLELPLRARSASFFACSRSISASLPLSSALWAIRNCRFISVCRAARAGRRLDVVLSHERRG